MGNMLVNQGSHQRFKIENVKQCQCLENRKFTTKQMRNKRAETGVNFCDGTVRNRGKEMGFTYREAK